MDETVKSLMEEYGLPEVIAKRSYTFGLIKGTIKGLAKAPGPLTADDVKLLKSAFAKALRKNYAYESQIEECMRDLDELKNLL